MEFFFFFFFIFFFLFKKKKKNYISKINNFLGILDRK